MADINERTGDDAHGADTTKRTEGGELEAGEHGDAEAREIHNPPHTTTGRMTAPKFGSAGSGGAEFEPGPGS